MKKTFSFLAFVFVASLIFAEDLDVRLRGYTQQFLNEKILPALVDGNLMVEDFDGDEKINCIDTTYLIEALLKKRGVITRVVWNFDGPKGFNHLFLQFRMNEKSKWVGLETTVILHNVARASSLFVSVEDYWGEQFNSMNNRYEGENDLHSIEPWRKRCQEKLEKVLKEWGV